MAKAPATDLPSDGQGECTLDNLASTAESPAVTRGDIKATSLKNIPSASAELGNALTSLSAGYLEAIKHALPALSELFQPTEPEVLDRPLAERSTDELLRHIDAGRYLSEIARLWKISTSKLNRWVAADVDRSARAKLSRNNQAALWDWAALQVLLHAPSDRVEIVRAEKIAQHCRWRAEAFGRDDYGRSIKVTQSDERNGRELTTRELKVIARGGVLPS